MLLREMFSPIGAPKEDQRDIDWLGDLKFFIDNDDTHLTHNLFPAIKRHREHVGNPDVFKVYIRPVERACEDYCNKFSIENREEVFPKSKLIELAKMIADEQEQHIKKGDYES